MLQRCDGVARPPTHPAARPATEPNNAIKQGRNAMEQQTGSTTTATPTPAMALSAFPVDLVGMGKRRMQALFDAQSKLVDTLPALSREWMSAAQAERELSSELLSKLTAARTLPESARAYQEWLSRRIDMFADETRMLLADTQKLVDVGARLFAIEPSGGHNGAAPGEPKPEAH
jgi:hypothetical protein